MVLLAVLLALLGVGVLVTTLFDAIIPAARGVRMRWSSLRAQFALSEATTDAVVRTPLPWLEPGDADTVSVIPAPDVRATVRRVAIGLPFVLARTEATARGQGAPSWGAARADVLLRRVTDARLAATALLAREAVTVDSGVVIAGVATAPAPWSGCPVEPVGAALRMVDSTRLVGGVRATIVGTPAAGVPVDSMAIDSLRTVEVALRRGAVRATTGTLAHPMPASTGTRCDLAADNWGEPGRLTSSAHACRGYAPVVVITPVGGTVTVDREARSQGALLIDGDLRVDAPLTHTGVLFVLGGIDATRAPLRVLGAVIATGDVQLSRGSVLSYSRCAAEGALLAAAPLVAVTPGGWSQP
ncbi:MAG: hypothetical protein MUE41_11825 [Gemmatimonadaceae bacterium]|jgi:hypothetical protein|nr:hypothetical protein [Gemmatimonadaceae bacterium]